MIKSGRPEKDGRFFYGNSSPHALPSSFNFHIFAYIIIKKPSPYE